MISQTFLLNLDLVLSMKVVNFVVNCFEISAGMRIKLYLFAEKTYLSSCLS